MEILGYKISIVNNKKTKNESKEIILWLDNYEEIFSDFDPRPFRNRELSSDFISETKKLVQEIGEEKISNIKLLIPKKLKDPSVEKDIINRVNEYFRINFMIAKKERKKLNIDGIKFISIGSSLILLLHLYLDKFESLKFVVLLLEPASWFSVWEGLHLMVFDSKDETPNFEFYEKIKESKIIFGSY